MLSARHGCEAIMEVFISETDINNFCNHKDFVTGNTALIITTKYDHLHYFKLLFDYSNINIKNDKGKTVIDYIKLYSSIYWFMEYSKKII